MTVNTSECLMNCMDGERSKCIVAMPRTGSELLTHYLCGAYDLEYVSELFNLTKYCLPDITIDLTQPTFRSRYAFHDGLPGSLTPEGIEKCVIERIGYVRDYERDTGRRVVVKTFAPTILSCPNALDLLSSAFDMVFLTRTDVLASAISHSSCRAERFWHGTHAESAEHFDNLLSNKITVDEDEFRETLTFHEFLLNKASEPGRMWVKYEQFSHDPFVQLAKIFGKPVSDELIATTKFIGTAHREVVTNYDRLLHILQTEFANLANVVDSAVASQTIN